MDPNSMATSRNLWLRIKLPRPGLLRNHRLRVSDEFGPGGRSTPVRRSRQEVLVPVTVHPILVTPDVERLRAFYAGLLGAEVVQRVPDDGPVFYLGLRVDDATLGLVVDDGAVVGNGAVAGEPGRVVLSIDVPDVDALLPRIADLGGRVTGGPTDMPWGQRVLHLQDPDGNAANLTQAL
jgi:predicted enzyme related to lactoylglutathione lyase